MNARFLRDCFERAVATYVEGFLGLLLVAGPLNIDAVEAALVAAIPAALAVIKAAVASQFGVKGTASLDPKA